MKEMYKLSKIKLKELTLTLIAISFIFQNVNAQSLVEKEGYLLKVFVEEEFLNYTSYFFVESDLKDVKTESIIEDISSGKYSVIGHRDYFLNLPYKYDNYKKILNLFDSLKLVSNRKLGKLEFKVFEVNIIGEELNYNIDEAKNKLESSHQKTIFSYLDVKKGAFKFIKPTVIF